MNILIAIIIALLATCLLGWAESFLFNFFENREQRKREKEQGTFKFGLWLVTALSLLLCGCLHENTQAICGHVVSVTHRGFGIRVAQNPTSGGTPAVDLGFFSSTVLVEPLSTNNLFAPNIANTFAIDQNVTPFSFGVNETFASGNYYTGNLLNTNQPVSSKPVVPSPAIP